MPSCHHLPELELRQLLIKISVKDALFSCFVLAHPKASRYRGSSIGPKPADRDKPLRRPARQAYKQNALERPPLLTLRSPPPWGMEVSKVGNGGQLIYKGKR